MKNVTKHLKHTLDQSIAKIAINRELFLSNPEKDFIRNRKLSLPTMCNIMLSMGSSSLNKELLDYFSYSHDTASSSAFVQQRDKIKPAAFQFLFNEFTSSATPKNRKNWNGYHLLAVDGTTLLLPRNQHQTFTFLKPNPESRGQNQLHLDALYDLNNRIYIDAEYQNFCKANERKAFISMVNKGTFDSSTIFIMDRGYSGYNIMAHVQHSGAKFIMRTKDTLSNGLASTLKTPSSDEFDIWVTLELSRCSKKSLIRTLPNYKYLPTSSSFDFFIEPFDVVYPITFRVTRVKLADNSYEVIFSNLDMDEFTPNTIKTLYHKRWGIETSFRKLKHTIGLASFHSKKMDFILQEIFVRLTLYNFCELITWNVVITKDLKKYSYQVNFTVAVNVCRYFLSRKSDKSPPDVEATLRRYILPIRDNRSFPRKVKDQSYISFLYRLS